MGGTILAALIILGIIAGANYAMNTIRNGATEFKKGFQSISKPTTHHNQERGALEEQVHALLAYVDNEGWETSSTITYVNNPVITAMLENIDKQHALEFHLPEKRVGVYAVIEGDERLSDTDNKRLADAGFNRYVLIRNHVIGYTHGKPHS